MWPNPQTGWLTCLSKAVGPPTGSIQRWWETQSFSLQRLFPNEAESPHSLAGGVVCPVIVVPCLGLSGTDTHAATHRWALEWRCDHTGWAAADNISNHCFPWGEIKELLWGKWSKSLVYRLMLNNVTKNDCLADTWGSCLMSDWKKQQMKVCFSAFIFRNICVVYYWFYVLYHKEDC